MNNWVIDYRIAQLAYEDRLHESERARRRSSSRRMGKLSPALMLALWGVIGFFYSW